MNDMKAFDSLTYKWCPEPVFENPDFQDPVILYVVWQYSFLIYLFIIIMLLFFVLRIQMPKVQDRTRYCCSIFIGSHTHTLTFHSKKSK